jgi:long-chain acyl-CoA synthetase
MNANLANTLMVMAERREHATAIKLGELRHSYAVLRNEAARMAGYLREHGVGLGDRVAVMLPNVTEFAIVYYGVLLAGGVVVPLNPLLKRREVAYHLSDSGAKMIFAWIGFTDEAEAAAAESRAECVSLAPGELGLLIGGFSTAIKPAQREENDTAVILYTSGTTGRPKGAELTHGNLGRNARVGERLFGLDDKSVVLGVLPLFHSFGQTCSMNATLSAGGTLVLLPRFEPHKALEIIAGDRVTHFLGVPTMYSALLNHSDRTWFDVSSLRVCVSGGASLPVELMRQFEAMFGCVILEGYGLSETSPIASFNRRDRARKAGSIGTPIEGVEMQVIDERGVELPRGEVGEIVIRGHNVMKGYWKQPEATADAISSDRWFRTGDLARVDEDGNFFIVDRKKDLIIRGGFNVYPREVEELLYQHPAVREVAVVGIPHRELGEEIGAAVVVAPGSATSSAELQNLVKAQLAAYKYPRHIWFVDELPKTATGKILKRAIQPPPGLAGR